MSIAIKALHRFWLTVGLGALVSVLLTLLEGGGYIRWRMSAILAAGLYATITSIIDICKEQP